jgi:DNA polymerase I
VSKYLIVDGNAVLHRAYYALPDWRNKSGEATAGVYGFLSMLIKTIDELKPTHLIIVFDTPAPTFRHNMYVGYQHNREKERQVSEDIWGQVEKLKIVFEKMDVPVFTAEGFEADDVIGTLAYQVEDEVVIITGDKDLMQLVNERVKLYMPQKGLSDNVLIDKDKVYEKLGVWPENVTDYKALVGDTSDSYAGVPGIGPVTAKKLIEKYGSFENIYQNLKEINNQKLIDGYESGELSKRLATIRRDVPVSIANVACLVPNKEKMIKVFQELGYKSLIVRSGGSPSPKATDGQESLF